MRKTLALVLALTRGLTLAGPGRFLAAADEHGEHDGECHTHGYCSVVSHEHKFNP